MIAMALANAPALLLADEPGTALDVTVQDQTLRLMRDLVARHETSMLFISHNLGVVREFADRAHVICRGRIVESGPVAAVFETPGHAYARALMCKLHQRADRGKRQRGRHHQHAAPGRVLYPRTDGCRPDAASARCLVFSAVCRPSPGAGQCLTCFAGSTPIDFLAHV